MCCSCTWEQRENINSCWIFIWFGTSNYYNWSCANASRQLSLLPSSISKVMRPEEFLQFKPWLLRAWFGESYEGCFCKNLCLNFHRPDVWLLWPTLNKKKKRLFSGLPQSFPQLCVLIHWTLHCEVLISDTYSDLVIWIQLPLIRHGHHPSFLEHCWENVPILGAEDPCSLCTWNPCPLHPWDLIWRFAITTKKGSWLWKDHVRALSSCGLYCSPAVAGCGLSMYTWPHLCVCHHYVAPWAVGVLLSKFLGQYRQPRNEKT